jgi:hypothetical protein
LAAQAAACSIDLGFLGPSRFCPARPENKAWISLDFLGFSRQNLDFSMGYAGFSAKKISRALLPLGSALGQEPVFLRCRSAVSLIDKSNSFSAFL